MKFCATGMIALGLLAGCSSEEKKSISPIVFQEQLKGVDGTIERAITERFKSLDTFIQGKELASACREIDDQFNINDTGFSDLPKNSQYTIPDFKIGGPLKGGHLMIVRLEPAKVRLMASVREGAIDDQDVGEESWTSGLRSAWSMNRSGFYKVQDQGYFYRHLGEIQRSPVIAVIPLRG